MAKKPSGIERPEEKPVFFMCSSHEDLVKMPKRVRTLVGFALHMAQNGEKHVQASPMKGFGGAGVLEVVEDFDGNTFRAIYTLKCKGAVYVLHCFQKKSKKGIATPKAEMDVINKRLTMALAIHEEKYGKKPHKS